MRLRLSEMVKEQTSIRVRVEKEILKKCPKCGELIFSERKVTIDEGFEGFLDIIDFDKLYASLIPDYFVYDGNPGDIWVIDARIEIE